MEGAVLTSQGEASGKNLQTILALQEHGVVQYVAGDDSFTISWAADKVSWTGRLVVTDPQPILRVSVPQEVTKISTTPKLSLLLLLLQEGWKVDEQATLLFKKKSSLRLPPTMLMRASTSLAALARREDIFKKGATQIELDQCDGCYKCLMNLSELRKTIHSEVSKRLETTNSCVFSKGCLSMLQAPPARPYSTMALAPTQAWAHLKMDEQAMATL